MSWLATSPHGPLGTAWWECSDCPAKSGGSPLGAKGGVMRDAARAHAETAGHHVVVIWGLTETLYPLALAAEDLP